MTKTIEHHDLVSAVLRTADTLSCPLMQDRERHHAICKEVAAIEKITMDYYTPFLLMGGEAAYHLMLHFMIEMYLKGLESGRMEVNKEEEKEA